MGIGTPIHCLNILLPIYPNCFVLPNSRENSMGKDFVISLWIAVLVQGQTKQTVSMCVVVWGRVLVEEEEEIAEPKTLLLLNLRIKKRSIIIYRLQGAAQQEGWEWATLVSQHTRQHSGLKKKEQNGKKLKRNCRGGHRQEMLLGGVNIPFNFNRSADYCHPS